jgi:hypothetical protein
MLLLSTLLGCNHPTAFILDGLSTEFVLLNSAGSQTEMLTVGTDIRLSYSITNLASEIKRYQNPDTGPIVTFEIHRDDNLVGTSDDGLAYATVIVNGSLTVGETEHTVFSWYSSELHRLLLPGEYIARAVPRLRLAGSIVPPAETLEFRVLPSNDVVITDEPSASLQLDPFTLNDAETAGDSLALNITYSGGCLEHDFTLFMSPSAFMESFPVQANLYLWHDDKDDACDAIITTTVSFSLDPLVDLYTQSYVQKDEIRLNVFGYFEDEPGPHLSVNYLPN